MAGGRPFFLLAHGIHGRGCDLDYLAGCLRQQFPAALCLQSCANELLDSNDGLLVCGDRLAKEACNFLASTACHPDPGGALVLVAIGHSLGGLVLRAALPRLLRDSPVPLRPGAYLSLLTPHLGVRRAAAGLLAEWRRDLTHGLVPLVAGQTGVELLLEDDSGVLQQLADPGLPFLQSLQRFATCTFVAMPHQDFLVPFCTASLMDVNPHLEPEEDDPPFYIASHAGFPTAYRDLLDRHAPSSAEREAATEDRLCSPFSGGAGSRDHRRRRALPLAGRCASPLSPGLVVDAAGELEFDPRTLQHLRVGLPGLRNLNVQFAPRWHPVHYHMAAIHQGLGKIAAGEQCVTLLLDLVARDLSTLGEADAIATHSATLGLLCGSTHPATFAWRIPIASDRHSPPMIDFRRDHV
eukprot:EG_transcript_13735